MPVTPDAPKPVEAKPAAPVATPATEQTAQAAQDQQAARQMKGFRGAAVNRLRWMADKLDTTLQPPKPAKPTIDNLDVVTGQTFEPPNPPLGVSQYDLYGRGTPQPGSQPATETPAPNLGYKPGERQKLTPDVVEAALAKRDAQLQEAGEVQAAGVATEQTSEAAAQKPFEFSDMLTVNEDDFKQAVKDIPLDQLSTAFLDLLSHQPAQGTPEFQKLARLYQLMQGDPDNPRFKTGEEFYQGLKQNRPAVEQAQQIVTEAIRKAQEERMSKQQIEESAQELHGENTTEAGQTAEALASAASVRTEETAAVEPAAGVQKAQEKPESEKALEGRVAQLEAKVTQQQQMIEKLLSNPDALKAAQALVAEPDPKKRANLLMDLLKLLAFGGIVTIGAVGESATK